MNDKSAKVTLQEAIKGDRCGLHSTNQNEKARYIETELKLPTAVGGDQIKQVVHADKKW